LINQVELLAQQTDRYRQLDQFRVLSSSCISLEISPAIYRTSYGTTQKVSFIAKQYNKHK